MEQQLKTLLDNILCEVNNVEMIAVVDRDGLPITSVMKADEDDVIGAVTASFDSFIARVKKEFTDESFQNITTIGDKKFFFADAGENAIFTIVGTLEVTDNELKVFGEFASGKIAALLNHTENVNVEIPKIVKAMSKFKNGKLPAGQFSAKVIVCGNYKVGKTSLIRRFVDDTFKENYLSTIGLDITKKSLRLQDDCSFDFVMWDIGGQAQQMIPYRKRFYSGANAAFIVCDLTRKATFDSIKTWLNDVTKEVGPKIPKILVGNKNDLIYDFEVKPEELEALAEELSLEYIVTSAKTSENVEEAFKYIAFKTLD